MAAAAAVNGFSTSTTTATVVRNRNHMTKATQTTTTLYSTAEDETTTTSTTTSSQDDILYIPLSFDEMVKQTSTAMEDAFQQGKKRQIIRILLPRSSDNDQIGQYYESNVVDDKGQVKEFVDLKLCPTDETWQVRCSYYYFVCPSLRI